MQSHRNIEAVFFLSARWEKIILPLNSIGIHPPVVIVGENGETLLGGFVRLLRLVSQYPDAAIFTDTGDRLGFVAWLVSVICRRKLIYRARGDVIRESYTNTGSFLRVFSNKHLFFPRLAGAVPCSDYLGNLISIDYPKIIQSKIKTVNLPIPLTKKGNKIRDYSEREKCIIIATKFHFFDKIKPLFDIVPILSDFFVEFPDFRCVVLGEGKYLDALKLRVKEYNLGHRMQFKGFVTNPQEYYGKAYCLLHLSDMDGYPSVIDEARINGLPVICSSTVGLPEMVDHGKDGFLLDHGFENFSSIIRSLMDPLNYERIVNSASRRINNNNSLHEIGHQFATAISSILASGNNSNTKSSKRKLRVLYVIKDYHRVGGAQRHLSMLLQNFDDVVDGFVICLAESNKRIFQEISGVPVEMGYGPLKYNLKNVWRHGKRVRNFVRNNRIDIVYCYGFEASVIGGVGAYRAGVPFLSRRGELAQWRKFKHLIVFSLVNLFADRILANSPQVLEITKKELFSRRKSELVRNCVSLESESVSGAERKNISIHTMRPVVGMVANLRAVKNQQMLIRAVPRIIDKGVDAEFWIIGEGQDQLFLQGLVDDLGLGNYVFLLGHRQDVSQLLSKMDCFVLTSKAEGAPNAILEAMSAGLPVVATAVGGNIDAVVDGHSGFLVGVDDMEGLAEQIALLMKEPDRARAMGLKGREIAGKQFSIHQSCMHHQRIFRSVLQQRHHETLKQLNLEYGEESERLERI